MLYMSYLYICKGIGGHKRPRTHSVLKSCRNNMMDNMYVYSLAPAICNRTSCAQEHELPQRAQCFLDLSS